MAIIIPTDFNAVVMTPPARVDKDVVPKLLAAAEAAGLPDFKGHRILHLHQVEQIDSSAVAGLMTIVEAARHHGMEFVACDPPPILRSYLEIYGAEHLIDGRVLSSAADGTYQTDLLPFVPPFVPHPPGRMDIYRSGKVRSYEPERGDLRELPAVDLNRHPPKAPARASLMQVATPEGERTELGASAYVWLRRHMCGCDATHTTFRALYELHRWYAHKGFDFGGVELWASDVPAGMVTERLTFRDRSHLQQFHTLLKIDSSWKQIGAPTEHIEEEYYYQYA
jgi:anti-anti-sigma regulatory factor